MYLCLILVFSSVCCSSAIPVPGATAGALSERGTAKYNENCWADVSRCPPGKFCVPLLRETYGMCLPCRKEGNRCYPLVWFEQHTCCEPFICDRDQHRCVKKSSTVGPSARAARKTRQKHAKARTPCHLCRCTYQQQCDIPGRYPMCCDTLRGFCRPVTHKFCVRLKAAHRRG